MTKYIIEGGNKLKGTIEISGNKNSVLPCLAAALLTDQEVTLHNVPHISDVEVFLEIFHHLGVEAKREGHTIKVRATKITTTTLPDELVNKLRASVLLLGPLLAREGKVKIVHPGGDVIGKRSIGTHIDSFTKLGYGFSVSDRTYQGKRYSMPQAQEIFMEEASVTATENLILATVISKTQLTLKNCAREPHVVDLCKMLIQMGAKIEGVGNSTLVIRGVPKLTGTDFSIGSDFVEFGTYAIAAAVTGGEIIIRNAQLADWEPVLYPLQKMGVVCSSGNGFIKTCASKTLTALPKLHTNIWPGFPTDMMSAMIVLATQAKGVTLCHDWMYESRMFFVDKLITMGAQITIADPHRVLVYGPSKLLGRNLETPDIRAGIDPN